MSRFKRALLIAGILLSAFLLVGTIIIKHPKTQAYLHENLERIASEAWEGAIKIGDLDAGLLPLHLELTNIRVIRHKGDTQPWLTLSRGVLKLSPWLTLNGKWVVDSLEIQNLKGTIDLRDPLFKSDTQAPSHFESPVQIESINITSSSVTLIHDKGTLKLGQIEGQLTPQKESYRAQFQLSQSTLLYDNQEYAIAGIAKGTIFGPVHAPLRLQLEGTELSFNGFKTRVVGSLDIKPTPQLNLGIELNGELNQLNSLHPELQAFNGKLSGSIRLKGAPIAPLVHLNVTLTSFQHKETPPYDIYLQGQYHDYHLKVDALHLTAPNGGSAQIQGELALKAPFTTEFNAMLTNASLGHILDGVGLANAWVNSPVSGTLSGGGTISPLALKAKAALSLSQFETLAGSYTNPKSKKILKLRPGKLDADVSVEPTFATVSNGRIQSGKSNLSVDGIFHYDGQRGMNLHFSSRQFHFANIGTIADVPFHGSGDIAGSIEGPYGDPVISATAELTNFAIFDYDLGTTKATLVYSDLVLDIPRVAIRRGAGTVKGSGNLNFRTKALETAGSFDLENVPTGELLDSVILATRDAKRFGGVVSGRAMVHGPIRNPTGVIRLKSPDFIVDGSHLGPARVLTTFGERAELLSINLNVKPKVGSINAYYALLPKGKMVLKATLDKVDVPLLTPMMGNIALKGTLTGEADLKGPASRLNGTINLEAKNLEAFGISLETTQINGISSAGTVSLSGTTFTGDATFDGQLMLSTILPYSATLQFKDLALERTHITPGGTQYIASGSVFSQGKLTRADSIMADANFDKLHLKIENTLLTEKAPVRVLFSNQTFDFQDVRLTGDDIQLIINGTAPLKAPLNLGIYASGSLPGINGLWSGIEFTRGKFDLNLRMGGVFGSPGYTGHFEVREGAIVAQQNRLTDISTRVEFQGQTISITKGTTKLGEGSSTFSGTILRFPDAPAQVNINASLKDINLTPVRDLELTTSGELNLIGQSNDLELRGDVSLESLRYTANLELQQFIKKQETPLRVPAFEPGQSWRLRINVEADDNLLVANNVLEAEFKTSLRITGTTDHVGAIGTVTPLWAKATYAGNTYEIERAILDFTEEYKIYSQFDVLATTKACGMELKVSINGNSDGSVVKASGKDEHGPVDSQDAWLCAQFGVRLQNYAKGDGTGLRDTLPGAVDALWKVSGMDERVRTLLPVVDELRLTSGYSKSSARVEPRVLLSKELGQDWELKYNGPIYYDDEQHVISLEYRLNSNATLESTWVSVSEVSIGDLGLDLRLKWEFE